MLMSDNADGGQRQRFRRFRWGVHSKQKEHITATRYDRHAVVSMKTAQRLWSRQIKDWSQLKQYHRCRYLERRDQEVRYRPIVTDSVETSSDKPYNLYSDYLGLTLLGESLIIFNSFTVTLSRKFAIKGSLQIPPHLNGVATLPCEILMSENIAYPIRCGTVF